MWPAETEVMLFVCVAARKIGRRQSLGTCPRNSLVANEDVQKPTKQTIQPLVVVNLGYAKAKRKQHTRLQSAIYIYIMSSSPSMPLTFGKVWATQSNSLKALSWALLPRSFELSCNSFTHSFSLFHVAFPPAPFFHVGSPAMPIGWHSYSWEWTDLILFSIYQFLVPCPPVPFFLTALQSRFAPTIWFVGFVVD